MTYLFGDSSPSNLEIDYIEFLREALEFSVAVLGAHERMMQGAARAVEVKREGDAEVNRLESLGAVVARAVEGFDIGADTSVTANCAQSLLRGAAETVRSVIDLVIAPSHLFGSVVRVDKLAERLEVHAPETGGWLRKEVKLRPQRL